MSKLILASNSPRRKEILTNAGYDFEVIPPNYDEKFETLVYSKEKIENCALQKALDVDTDSNNIIIAADTVVVSEGIILTKPKDKTDAIKMLEALNNKTHFVATSICLIKNENILKDTDITYVTFRKLSQNDILNYIENEKPFDKAGSYGIQDKGFNFAIKIQGELDNVIGFPLKLFERLYQSIK